MPHKVGDVAKIVRREQQTIRDWTSRFEAHLSPGANPGSGKTRVYTDDDLAVFVEVRQQLDNGLSLDEIDASLTNKGVTKADAELFIQQQQLQSPEARAALVSFYESQLDTLRSDSDAMNAELQSRIDELQKRIDNLHIENGELQGQLKGGGVERVIELERKIAVLEYQIKQLKSDDS